VAARRRHTSARSVRVFQKGPVFPGWHPCSALPQFPKEDYLEDLVWIQAGAGGACELMGRASARLTAPVHRLNKPPCLPGFRLGLACYPPSLPLPEKNTPPKNHAAVQGRTPEEVVGILRRGSVGFAR
jgi:hypothetical protein